ncbi:Receptor-like protein 46 [Linum grandiflorum]
MAIVLSNNQFSGPLTRCISNISTLALLDLSRNRLFGEPFKFLCQQPASSCPNYIDLSFNSFHGIISIASISERYELGVLELSHNKFSGIRPQNLATLKFLDLNDNNMSGEIPTFLSQMSSLEILVLRNNILHGLIPEDLSNLTTVRILDLSGNKLSGRLPESLGNLKSLKVLNVSHNRLSGRIPTSLGEIRDLESLDLSHNNLSGENPESLGKLLQITDLQLSYNSLTGRIPNGPQMDRMNDLNTYANNDGGLCGMQIQKSCGGGGGGGRVGEGKESENEDGLWFSWMTAGIGYPAGFATTVFGMYGFGYFHRVPRSQRRRRRPIRF